jgi:hypothetical protein
MEKGWIAMKKIMILGLISAMLNFGAAAPPTSAAANSAGKQNTNQVVQAILQSELVPTYSESEATSATGESMAYKTWDNSMNGQYSTEENVGAQTTHYASEGDKALAFADGDSRAIEYNAAVKVSPNDAKPVIKGMQQTTAITFVGNEKMLNRSVYHVKSKGKTVAIKTNTREGVKSSNYTYPDMELWVDIQTGFIMKQKYGKPSMGYSYDTVVKVDFAPKFNSAAFQLTLPKGVTIINADDLLKEQQK